MQVLDAYPGTFMLQNEATGRCLKQQDFYRVISASCDGSKAEFRWEASSDYGWVWSANTNGLLVTDFTRKVSLYNSATAPTNQGWFWKSTAGPADSASASPAVRLVR
uniref:ricin-type beta-trefoil lectin domain protein n=1 Tax=Micromonospora acroterricola TaxID=2202421 RepID=UPI0011B5E762|nr:ricin-type beta-trefoil lectin domain protein [Micromonospora acroterricola]